MLGRLTGQGDEGGATLYQQLAKVLYTPGRSGLFVEAEQVALAVKLNFSYSKPEILRMYASVVYFGHGFYGLAAASCGYFGRPARRCPGHRPRCWLAWSRGRPPTTRSFPAAGPGPGRPRHREAGGDRRADRGPGQSGPRGTGIEPGSERRPELQGLTKIHS
jgi:hypothetical protein